MPLTLVLCIFIIIAASFAHRKWYNAKLRQKRLATPLSDREWAIIIDQVPLCQKLPHDLRAKLSGKINLFLHQVEFLGCNELEVTEEMELSIAAQACLLIVNTDTWYDTLQTILIYPGAFKSISKEYDGYVVREREVVRLGESWARGPVILSWAHAAEGAFVDDDGHNVVLHEFAHQIDGLSGHTDGAPVLAKDHKFSEWQRTLNEAYNRLIFNTEMGRKTFLDSYGATAPQEFFAVAVEVFFERPTALKQEEPAVYAQMSKYFQLDPSKWD